MGSKKTLVAIIAAVALSSLTAVARADLVIQITSPTDGATISRAASGETLEVTGTAAFAPAVSATKRFYVRRAGCGSGQDNRTFLSVVLATDAGDGCGNLLGVVSEATTNYPADDGVPFVVDTAGKVTGQVTTSSFRGISGSPVGLGVGQQTITVRLTGNTTDGQFVQLLSQSKTYLVTPNQPTYVNTFEAEVDDSFLGARFEDLSLSITYGSGVLLHGFTGASGSSFFDIPILDGGSVQVAVDSSTFSASRTVTAIVEPDGVWAAEVPIPAVGTRRIYARAMQTGQTTVKTGPVTITVTN